VDNPITGEKQRVQLPQQEVVLGPQARSEMAAQYGGLPDNLLQQYVDQTQVCEVGGEERSLRIPSAA